MNNSKLILIGLAAISESVNNNASKYICARYAFESYAASKSVDDEGWIDAAKRNLERAQREGAVGIVAIDILSPAQMDWIRDNRGVVVHVDGHGMGDCADEYDSASGVIYKSWQDVVIISDELISDESLDNMNFYLEEAVGSAIRSITAG